MRVYLCGPINGCTDEECKDWREMVKKELGEENCLDPMRRDYRGREHTCYVEIVELDKLDILQCDYVLVNFDKPSVGTAMEILFAWMNHIPVFVVRKDGTIVSPWLRYHTTQFFSSFESAVEEIRNVRQIEYQNAGFLPDLTGN